jgi:phosphoribosylglycinamide formyltransferase-1
MSQRPPVRLGVLISGRGSNLAALQDALESGKITDATIVLVVSNHANALGLSWAEEQGLKIETLSAEQAKNRHRRDEAIVGLLKENQVDVLLLAGYDRILGPELLAAFPQRILNIHPSLLPAYGGRGMVGTAVHQAVLAAGEIESGCTVHLVSDVVDGGEILGQKRVPVLAGDTAESLAQRVLQTEHELYAKTVQHFLQRLKTVNTL